MVCGNEATDATYMLKSDIAVLKMAKSQLRVTDILADLLLSEILKQLRNYRGL